MNWGNDGSKRDLYICTCGYCCVEAPCDCDNQVVEIYSATVEIIRNSCIDYVANLENWRRLNCAWVCDLET